MFSQVKTRDGVPTTCLKLANTHTKTSIESHMLLKTYKKSMASQGKVASAHETSHELVKAAETV